MSMSSVASPEMVAEAMVTVNGGFQPAPMILGKIVTAGTTTVSTTSTTLSTRSTSRSTTTQNSATQPTSAGEGFYFLHAIYFNYHLP